MDILDTDAAVLESRAFMNDSEAQAELKRRAFAHHINEVKLPELVAVSTEL